METNQVVDIIRKERERQKEMGKSDDHTAPVWLTIVLYYLGSAVRKTYADDSVNAGDLTKAIAVLVASVVDLAETTTDRVLESAMVVINNGYGANSETRNAIWASWFTYSIAPTNDAGLPFFDYWNSIRAIATGILWLQKVFTANGL